MKHTTYNILYIEDQDPKSIILRIEDTGIFKVTHISPKTLDDVLASINGSDLLLLDFKLTEEVGMKVDAPTIASALRTYGSDSHKDIPIVLISTRTNIANYYRDFSSKDLFDFTTTKEEFLRDIEKFRSRFLSVINSYEILKNNKGDLCKILNIEKGFKEKLDYRINFNLEKDTISHDIFAYSNFILQNLIRSVGVLIGEDVLSARLGISKESKDWDSLLRLLSDFKYSGIFSESYNRWWAQEITNWFDSHNKERLSLRKLNAEQRCEAIKKISGLEELIPLHKIEDRGYKALSSNFWVICKETKIPIDPIDGFELYERELYPWQEKEYISFIGKSSEYSRFLKPADKKRIFDIEKSLR